MPTILARITEHHGCYRTCGCGQVNHAPVPAAVRAHSVGPNLTAAIVYFAGSHGMSKRGIEETVETLFGVPIALGTIANLANSRGAHFTCEHLEGKDWSKCSLW